MKSGLPLLFDWPARHVVHFGLPSMLVVSLLAHAVGLAAFHLAPSSPVAPRRSASASFLPTTPEFARAALPAIDAADPSLYSPAASEARELWDIPQAEYSPAFDAPKPTGGIFDFQRLSDTGPPATFTRRGPVPVELPVGQESRPSGPPPTRVMFSGGVMASLPSIPPLLALPENEALRPAEFLIVAGADGKIRHVFMIRSSGSALADRSALALLFKSEFSVVTGSDNLGAATFHWGRAGAPVVFEKGEAP